MKALYLSLMFFACACGAMAQSYPVSTLTQNYTDSSRGNRAVAVDIYFPGTTSGGSSVANDSFPFVVFGHGFQMQTVDYIPFVDSLLPKGYIVAFANTENSLQPSHADFAKDLTFIYQSLIRENADSTSIFYKHVVAKGAIGGHSMGGGCTVLSAQYSEPAVCYFGFAEANTTPSSQMAAASMTRPYLTFSGSYDCIAPYATHQRPTYDACGSSCKTIINIQGASHCQFGASNSLCNVGESFSNCANPPMPRATQITTVMQYLQPYLDHHLKGSAAASATFDSTYRVDNVNTKATNCAGLISGIEDEKYKGMRIYPNPATDVLYIRTDQAPIEVKIMDELGRQVLTQNAPGLNINIAGVPAGIYIVQVITRNDHAEYFKIIKQ